MGKMVGRRKDNEGQNHYVHFSSRISRTLEVESFVKELQVVPKRTVEIIAQESIRN